MLLFSTHVPEGTKTIRLCVTYSYDDNPSAPDEVVEFNISTYRKLTKEIENISATCTLVNEFLKTYDNTSLREFFLYCSEMHKMLNDLRPGGLISTIQTMTDQTAKICEWMDLPKRATEYVRQINIPLPPDRAKSPQRLQDTAEKTFSREEYYYLTGISLVCKVLSPVLGECVDAMQPPVADKANKELFAFMLILPVLETGYFSTVYAKLTHYINDMTEKATADLNSRQGGNEPSIAFTLAKNGVDEVRFNELVHSMIYVKKLVTFDVWNSGTANSAEPDIMKYIYVSVFETARSKLNTIKHQSNVLARFDQSDSGSGTQDNATHLEHVSRVSKITADIPQMAHLGLLWEIPRILERSGITQAQFDSAEKFYAKNMIKPSAFSRALIASFLGRWCGGSTMLLHLTRVWYTKALIVTQLYLAKNGYDQLAIMISSGTPDLMRSGPMTGVGHRINENYDKTELYLKCIALFPGFSEKSHHKTDPTGRNSSGEDYISIQNQLKRLMNWVIEYDHTINVAPAVWSIMKVPAEHRPVTGDIVLYNEEVMNQVCAFFIQVHTPQPVTPQIVTL